MNQALAFPGNAQGIPTRATNPQVMPRFKVEHINTGEIDAETGLPKYVAREVVELHSPGDLKNVPVHRVNAAYIDRFRTEYDAWKRTGSAESDLAGTGLPLTHWPQMPMAIAASLSHAKVFTVEQLAGLSDTQCSINGAMGIRKYRDMAAAFVDQSRAAAPIARLDAENEALRQEMALLKKQMEQVSARAVAAEEKLGGAPEIPDLSTPRDTGAKKGKN